MKKLLRGVLSVLFAGLATAQTPTPHPGDSNADNTARNAGAHRDPATADEQPNKPDDLKLLQAIRKAVVADKPLSMTAKNCKILVRDGTVTLRGPVNSEQEKSRIAELATQQAGRGKVLNELEVKAAAK